MNRQQTGLVLTNEPKTTATIQSKKKKTAYTHTIHLSGRRLVVIWCNLLDLTRNKNVCPTKTIESTRKVILNKFFKVFRT